MQYDIQDCVTMVPVSGLQGQPEYGTDHSMEQLLQPHALQQTWAIYTHQNAETLLPCIHAMSSRVHSRTLTLKVDAVYQTACNCSQDSCCKNAMHACDAFVDNNQHCSCAFYSNKLLVLLQAQNVLRCSF
jgi:hypothetical protein